ncbi:MAG TPA: UvrB/UvrC motif-containing protein [Methanosarcinales archaeon]|nr:UvrB/UvrC motif-containing protein [Methanosarcinales archaeon]
MKPKFKVGETVQLIASPDIRVFILETMQQTCYADCVQNWYSGRVVYSGLHRTVGKIERFSEIELQLVAQASVELKTMVANLKELKAKKEAFIRSQDFEKASAMRDEYHELEMQVELLSDAEGISLKDVLK